MGRMRHTTWREQLNYFSTIYEVVLQECFCTGYISRVSLRFEVVRGPRGWEVRYGGRRDMQRMWYPAFRLFELTFTEVWCAFVAVSAQKLGRQSFTFTLSHRRLELHKAA